MKKMTGIILMVLGVVFLITGSVLYQNSAKEFSAQASQTEKQNQVTSQKVAPAEEEKPKQPEPEIKPVEKEMGSPIAKLPPEQVQKNILTQEEINKQKGDDFERFVAEKFDPEFFTILEWTSDKAANGMFVMSNMNPDIVLQFGKMKYKFAVECKYRSNYYNDELEFTYDEQLQRYKKYENEQGIPVFIVIGIGGTAKSPESLFVVPVRELTKGTMSRKELSAYYKNPNKEFFYNFSSKSLQ